MDYCGPRGIPHSKFLTWSEGDQDKAIAWMLADLTRCPTCGTVPEDWLDEDGKDREPPPFEARSKRCVGCATILDVRKQIPDESQQSVHVYLVPYERDRGGRGNAVP
jgi:hypothetical protein